MKEILRAVTKNPKETQKIAEVFAREILSAKNPPAGGAIVIGLEGDLGAGKTTFTKGFAKGLGIKEEMKSPTFILMRIFQIPRNGKQKHFLHFDAYRIDDAKEFAALGFKGLLKNKNNILLVEWSDRIKKLLPKNYFRFVFKHGEKNIREIKLYA